MPALVVVQYLESGGGEEEKLRALESAKCSQEVIRVAFAGMHTLLSAAVRLPGLKTEVCSELSSVLGDWGVCLRVSIPCSCCYRSSRRTCSIQSTFHKMHTKT